MSEPDYRIGTAEREAAIRALEEHLVAGRLDVDEYGQRSAQASVARTAADLRPLFADLPVPHAIGGSQRAAVSQPAGPSAAPARARHGNPLFGRAGESLVALAPFVALLLFFGAHLGWWVFLLIPVSGIVVYGNQGEAKRARRTGRDRR
ncbi:MAG: DUF1707 domain-containing protein [Jatrophihabitantaceae bacterium]